MEINEDDPNLQVVNLTKKSQPRESDSDADEANNRIVIPDTGEGLRDQFNQLFGEFTGDKKHEHGHELTVLLDEMLERGTITPFGV